MIPAGVFYYNISDLIVSATTESAEEIEDKIKGELRLKGMVNSDKDIAEKMDNTEGTSLNIPVSRKADGGFDSRRSKVMNTEQFNILGRFVDVRAIDTADRIAGGDIRRSPYKDGQFSSCDRCPYGAVCGFSVDLPGCNYRKLKKFDDEVLWNNIKEGLMRMERKWTPAQKSAIDTRDCNVLVSAAAGSGKTAVLVERIISMITDPDKNIDIDRLVVVTFTKAAAAQMKDKIRKALDSMLDENPRDVNLLRQITLLNNAQITTIDSFCLWIIRNHFPEVNLDPGFRIMDEGEKKLIENDVLEDVLEEFYAEADEEFFNLVDAFGMGRDDSGLVSIIDKIYRFSRSNPWIDEWFDECMLVYDDETLR